MIRPQPDDPGTAWREARQKARRTAYDWEPGRRVNWALLIVLSGCVAFLAGAAWLLFGK